LIKDEYELDLLKGLPLEQLDVQKEAKILIATKSTLGLTENPHLFFKNQTTECCPEDPAASAALQQV
jgi:hypothetical protein